MLRNPGLLTGALFLLPLAACTITIDPTFDTAEEEFSTSFAPDNIDRLQIDWENGRITIVLDETATEITVEGTKRVTVTRADDDTTAALADLNLVLAPLDIDSTALGLRFDAVEDETRVYNASVTITLPVALDLSVENRNGSIRLEDTARNADISVNNGSVTALNHTGNLTVGVDNGAIDIDSTNGDVNAETGNGGIQITARPPENGVVIATATSGGVELNVPADFAAQLTLTTTIGVVDADLSAFTVNNLDAGIRAVNATLNGGGGTITGTVEFGGVQFGAIP